MSSAVTPEPPVQVQHEPEPIISFPVIAIDDKTADHIADVTISADEQGVSKETDSQGRCTLAVRPKLNKIR